MEKHKLLFFFHLSLDDLTAMIFRDNLKCGLIRPQHIFLLHVSPWSSDERGSREVGVVCGCFWYVVLVLQIESLLKFEYASINDILDCRWWIIFFGKYMIRNIVHEWFDWYLLPNLLWSVLHQYCLLMTEPFRRDLFIPKHWYDQMIHLPGECCSYFSSIYLFSCSCPNFFEACCTFFYIPTMYIRHWITTKIW